MHDDISTDSEDEEVNDYTCNRESINVLTKGGRAAKQSTKINPKKKGRRTGMIMLRPQLKEQRKTNCLN